jgi:hypothetical protein
MAHEILVDLFRNRPSLAAELLTEAIGAALPPYGEARLASIDLTETRPAAIDGLDEDRARFYFDLVYNSLNEAARRR